MKAHAHFLYIYYFNFVFFIVLSRIEINETHVNPYSLEPVCLLFISSSLYKIWCMFYTSCVVEDVWEFICSCTRSNKSGKGWGMMKRPVFCGGQQLQTYTQIHGCFSFRCRVYTQVQLLHTRPSNIHKKVAFHLPWLLKTRLSFGSLKEINAKVQR